MRYSHELDELAVTVILLLSTLSFNRMRPVCMFIISVLIFRISTRSLVVSEIKFKKK